MVNVKEKAALFVCLGFVGESKAVICTAAVICAITYQWSLLILASQLGRPGWIKELPGDVRLSTVNICVMVTRGETVSKTSLLVYIDVQVLI